MNQNSIQVLINTNAAWTDVRTRLAEAYRVHAAEMLALLDCCRASKKLRQVQPYLSLGRLGLERWDAYERGVADSFVCLYYHNEMFVVSNYDNTAKAFFDTAKAAVSYVEQHLGDGAIFS